MEKSHFGRLERTTSVWLGEQKIVGQTLRPPIKFRQAASLTYKSCVEAALRDLLQLLVKRPRELLQTFVNLRAGPGGEPESESRIHLFFHKTG